MRIVSASKYNSPCCKFPTYTGLAKLGNSELDALASRLARVHQSRIAQLSPAELTSYATGEHQYGVRLRTSTRSSTQANLERLQDLAFWRRVVNRHADASRERQEILAGRVGSHGQKFCSDLTLRILEEREQLADRKLRGLAKTRQAVPVTTLKEITRARSNKKYLLARALLEVAKNAGFKAFFLTVTCPERPIQLDAIASSSSEGMYDGSYDYLLKLWDSLSDYLRGRFKPQIDFYGFRATEVHEDGCPHYHIILFCNPIIEPLLRKRIAKLFNDDASRPAGYFDKYQQDIIKELDLQSNERALFNYSLKMLFDDNQSTPEIQHDRNEKRRRSNHAIKAARKRGVQFFGVEGLQQKMDMVKKSARDNTACSELKEIGRKLTIDRNDPHHNQTRLSAVVNFIRHEAHRLELIRTEKRNKYGEATTRVTGIRLCPAKQPPKLPNTGQSPINPFKDPRSRAQRYRSAGRKPHSASRPNPRKMRVTHNTSRYIGHCTSLRNRRLLSSSPLIYAQPRRRSRRLSTAHHPSRAPPAQSLVSPLRLGAGWPCFTDSGLGLSHSR